MLTNCHTEVKNILVVGGAGFIGSHMVHTLTRAGFRPIVLDNLTRGHRQAVGQGVFILGDMKDEALLTQVFKSYALHAVMHFAGWIEVAESVTYPEKYYQNNVAATLTLFDVMRKNKVSNLIFSSSAAVYGAPHALLMNEAHPVAPLNPYGRTKWMIEEIIKDYAHSGYLNYAILRYFNASGADVQYGLGERHEPESHLIPLILRVAKNKQPHITVYGDDYATVDGTCVRDYVHVKDICNAHLRALEKLLKGDDPFMCNLGTGTGYSVMQVIQAARAITQHPIPHIIAKRRAGDPALLVADATRAMHLLQWQPLHSCLDEIIQDSWRFLQQ